MLNNWNSFTIDFDTFDDISAQNVSGWRLGDTSHESGIVMKLEQKKKQHWYNIKMPSEPRGIGLSGNGLLGKKNISYYLIGICLRKDTVSLG